MNTMQSQQEPELYHPIESTTKSAFPLFPGRWRSTQLSRDGRAGLPSLKGGNILVISSPSPIGPMLSLYACDQWIHTAIKGNGLTEPGDYLKYAVVLQEGKSVPDHWQKVILLPWFCWQTNGLDRGGREMVEGETVF